jgi:uncharacterized protein YgfB (UPF0149 family)
VQAGIYHSGRYSEVATLAVKRMLEGTLSAEERQQLEGEQAEVVATYAEGAGTGYLVSTDSEPLRRRLENVAEWQRVPAPSSFQLQYRQVTFQVSLDRGAIRVGLLPQ